MEDYITDLRGRLESVTGCGGNRACGLWSPFRQEEADMEQVQEQEQELELDEDEDEFAEEELEEEDVVRLCSVCGRDKEMECECGDLRDCWLWWPGMVALDG